MNVRILRSQHKERKHGTLFQDDFFKGAVTAAEAYAAAAVLNEGRVRECGNWFLLREQLRVLSTAIMMAMFFIFLIIWRTNLVEIGIEVLLSATLLGIAGAGISAIRSSCTVAANLSVWQGVLRTYVTMLRLIVGAVVGFVIGLLLQSGVIDIGELTNIGVLSFAFVAGFSERFFVSRIESFAEANNAQEKAA